MDKRKLRRWSGRAVTTATLLLAAGLMAGSLVIYSSGSYTREKAATVLMMLLPVFALWLAAVVWGKQVWPAASRRGIKVLRAEHAPHRRLRAILYAVAIAFLLLGVMNGGMRDVLIKAINICTECIGLG